MAIGYILAIAAITGGLYVWLQTGDNEKRKQAIRRVAFGVPFLLLMFIAGSLFGAYVVIVFALDVMWEFLTGREGFDTGGRAERWWSWKDANTRWLLTGRGQFQFLP